MSQVYDRIEAFNAGRIPEFKERKYRAMEGSPFSFFRATCHLFYENWPAGSSLDKSPAVWSCGDLHIENFGSCKGDNRLAYFDINDFDEAILAPASRDVIRFLSSLFAGASFIGVDKPGTVAIANCFLEEYSATLVEGHSRSVERETAKGMVRDLLKDVSRRNRADFLARRTVLKKSHRRFKTDGRRFFALPDDVREDLSAFVQTLADTSGDPEFFQLLDAAGRIAGTGSLGLRRYALLVNGKGSPDRNYILEIKQAKPSSLAPHISIKQPSWASEADRIASIQMRMQATPPAFLRPVLFRKEAYLLKELQPSEDRVDISLWKGKIRRLERVIRTMGRILAWDQLRSSGRQGSAIADELIEFGRCLPAMQKELLGYAEEYKKQLESYYKDFCEVRRTLREEISPS